MLQEIKRASCALCICLNLLVLVSATPQSTFINVDLDKTEPLAPDLFGIFFEEVSRLLSADCIDQLHALKAAV